MTLASNGTGMDHFLTPTGTDAGHRSFARRQQPSSGRGVGYRARSGRIYYYDATLAVTSRVLSLPRAGTSAAPAVIGHGVAFCMGKASSSSPIAEPPVSRPASRSRRSTPPIRSFCPPRIFVPYGRPNWPARFPWHSLGEAYLGRRWVKLDATIDAPTAARLEALPARNSTNYPRSRRWKEPSCGKTAASRRLSQRGRCNGTNESLSRS